MANEKTPNYHWDIPSPYGLQIVEMIKVASTFGAIDSQIKACADAIQSHKHSFQDITNRPTTLDGYGITDAITTEQVRREIETSQDAQQSVIDQSISDLASSTAAALDVRLRFDAQQAIPLIQRARARANINALGIEDKGAPNGVATLDAGGKIPSSQLPPVAITDTFVVNSQASMLALVAERGDVAVRTDLNKSFILRVEPATALANWQEMLTPTDAVLTVNGKTGAVTVTKDDVNLGNVANKSEEQLVSSGALADALGRKLDKAGGTIGAITVEAPTNWSVVEIRAKSGMSAAIDFTGGGTSNDYNWRIQNANDWDLDFHYGGAGGGAHGLKMRINRDGNFIASGNVGAFSDERLKTEIKDISGALDKVLSLSGKYYLKDNKYQYGFIAQASLKAVPELVGENTDANDPFIAAGEETGTLFMDAGNQIPALLVEAIRDIDDRLRSVEEKLK